MMRMNPSRRRLLEAIGMRPEAKYAPDQTGYWEGVALKDWRGEEILTTAVRLLPAAEKAERNTWRGIRVHTPRKHRLQVLCSCGEWVPAGRLGQHMRGTLCQGKRG